VVEIGGLISTITNSTGISGSGNGAGTKTSLNAKLQAALDALAAGDIATACSKLQDFVNEVNAQKVKKKISVSVANSLINSAAEIMSQLGCNQVTINTTGPDGRLSIFNSNSTLIWTLISLVTSLRV
jgi:hypothetical protein